MVELPKTEEELKAYVENAISSKVEELSKKHNEEMANLRVSHKKEIEKINNQNNLTAEEKAKALAEEKEKALNDELNDLRSFKKKSTLEARLEKEGLPKYLSNDNRLLSAEDGELDKVLKVVKEDYNGSLPKGNQHSSVVQTANGVIQNQGKDTKEIAYEKVAETLKDLI